MSTPQFELSEPPSDAISALKFAPAGPRLLVASWDKNVYLYEIANGTGRLLRTFAHRAPVLGVCWGEGEEEAYTAGLDWDVRRIDLRTGEQTVLSSHGAGVKCLAYSPKHRLLVSASWDHTLHVHDRGAPDHPPMPVALPSKPFSVSASDSKLVVAMASRAVHIYDLKGLALLCSQAGGSSRTEVEPWQRRESSLKYMTRAVACTPDDSGYASSSIEGRVAVEWFDPSPDSQARKYAFKCHRQAGAADGVDVVYPVNALAFHPVHGTFASGGGDGTVSVWDALAKKRIRNYSKFPASVAALDFSADGKLLAVGVSPGFEDGREGEGEGAVKVFVKELAEGEARGKGGGK